MRSYRELWAWLGGSLLTLFPFLTAVAIAYFLKDARYSLFGNFWMLGALIAFLAAFTCFLGATLRWPFPPWAKPRFPDITVEISGTASTDTERESSTGLDVPVRLRSFMARFTSEETEQRATLTVVLYARLVPGSWGRAGEAICPPPTWALPPSLNLTPVAMPFFLSPGEAVDGQLVYEIPRYYLDKISDPFDARLEIADQVSGKKVSIPAEIGSYGKDTMSPAAGGIEILGPEYGNAAISGPAPGTCGDAVGG